MSNSLGQQNTVQLFTEDSVSGKPDVVKSTNGAPHFTSPSYSFVKYTGSGYTYLCEAAMGTARSTSAWRVARITDATGDIVYAGAVGATVGTFAFAATDLATVAALTYTLAS